MEIEQALRRIVGEIAEVEEDSLTLETHFVDDLDMDSMDAIEVMVMIESEFEIDLLETDVERVRTFGELLRELTKLLRAEADSSKALRC